MPDETTRFEPILGPLIGTLPPSDMPPPFTLPKRKTRSLTVDAEEVVKDVLARVKQDLSDRSGWMDNHLRLYAKYRGWTEQKAWQFEDASNAHLPIMMYTCQRIEDALFNAVMSQRPLLQAKALQKQNAPKESRVNHLLDYQFFVCANAAKLLADGIQNLVVDGSVHFMIPWVRGTQTMRLFTRLPAPPSGVDLLSWLSQQFVTLYGDTTSVVSRRDHHFALHTPDGELDVEVYEGIDGDVELIEQRDLRIDHLGLMVEDIEDIVVPSNCTNPQPPSESNPRGAHHVTRLCTASLDTVRQRRRDGVYDLLNDADITTLESWTDQQSSEDNSQAKEQKDEMEGVQSQSGEGEQNLLQVLEVYDRYDVNNDGMEEDVIFWILCNANYAEGRLARARYLTEIVPPGPQGARRPIEKIDLFPVTNRYYAIGFPELVEGSQDLMNMMFNFGADAGVISNAPFGFYRAASGLKAEQIRLSPGILHPLDDPRTDVYFPQLPAAGGTWVFNELALLNQFLEKLTMQSALSFGSVPQGKSAALRTTGNMSSVLQQSDMRSERILRRLMEGLSRLWCQGLALLQQYLPPSTEYRILGAPESQETFDRILDRREIAGRFHFQWMATILNSNPQIKQQTALSLLQILANPMVLQMQLTGPEEVHRALRRYVETLDEPNPDQFIKRPPGVSSTPKLTAEMAISMFLDGQSPPDVNPVEPLQEHAEKLLQFLRSPALGVLTPHQNALFAFYLKKVMELLVQSQQQAQMIQAAQQFQQQMGGGGNGQGGQPGPAPGPPNPAATSLSPTSPAEAGMGPQTPGGTV